MVAAEPIGARLAAIEVTISLHFRFILGNDTGAVLGVADAVRGGNVCLFHGRLLVRTTRRSAAPIAYRIANDVHELCQSHAIHIVARICREIDRVPPSSRDAFAASNGLVD
jgi:hypothetical protein